MDVDSDSDVGDSSLLLGNDDVVQVSEPPPLFVDINLSVNMADAGLTQDGAVQQPVAPATDLASKDGWLAPMKFTGTSSKTHSSGGALSNYIQISISSPIGERWRFSL